MTSSEKPTLTALKPALQGGNTLSPFSGAQSTKDGAKEDLKSLDLLKVYTFLFPHKNVGAAKSTGETLVSCFNDSGHSNGDQNPSMALNNVKNTYHCFGCETSGDIIDLIACKNGYANSNGRCPDDKIHQAVFDANQDLKLGWEFHLASDGRYYRGPGLATTSSTNNVLPMPAGMVADEPVIQPPPIQPPEITELEPLDWRSLVENDTALRTYMEIVCQDDIAEEFHFWNFMVLLGLMIGRDARFADATPVHGNLFVCLNGPTSAGKSRSMSYIKRLIAADEIKFDPDDPYSDGIKVISGPGSGEALTRAFQHESIDPTQTFAGQGLVPGQKPKGKQPVKKITHPVRGFVKYEELTTIIKKASSDTSTIKPMMIELYDCGEQIGGDTVNYGSHVAEKPYGSILTSIQPTVLENIFGGSDDGVSGFLNRWLFIPGNHKKSRALMDYIDVDPVIPWLVEIREWAAGINTNQRGLIEFLYKEDRNRFEKYYEDKLHDLRDKMGFERIDLTFKKLVLLGCALYMEDHISSRALDFAEYLVEWLIKSNGYQRVESLDDTEFDRMYGIISNWTIKAGKKGIYPSVLAKKCLKKSGSNVQDFNRAFDHMIKTQEIVVPVDETGKKLVFDASTYFAYREEIAKGASK